MLQDYLRNSFQILSFEELDCRFTGKEYTVAEAIQLIKNRNSEEKVIDIIKIFELEDKKDVLNYLAGIMDRLILGRGV